MSSSSSLEKARVALEELNKIVSISPASASKPLNMGVIYSLKSENGRVYIGSEYEGRIAKELKDLLVRYVGYKSMGYLYESSAGVFEDGIVDFALLEKVLVSSKYELARKAEEYMLELGRDVCVNIYKPENLRRGFAIGLYEDDIRLEEIERYKLIKEKELESMGVYVVEYSKERMVYIRSMRDELYEKQISF